MVTILVLTVSKRPVKTKPYLGRRRDAIDLAVWREHGSVIHVRGSAGRWKAEGVCRVREGVNNQDVVRASWHEIYLPVGRERSRPDPAPWLLAP